VTANEVFDMIARLAAGFVVVGCCFAPLPVRAEKHKSWIGKQIMPTSPGIRILNSDEYDQTRYVATLMEILYTVADEQGGLIKVRERGASGWFAKKNAVLLEDAITHFTARIRQNKKDAYAYVCRGTARKMNEAYDAALKDYNEAIRLESDSAAWFVQRGTAWEAKKEYGQAMKDYNEAVRLDPRYVYAFNNRGNVWAVRKEYDKALKDYDEVVRLAPRYEFGYCNRAWLRATCPDAKYRNGRKAVESARMACDLTGWKDANTLDTLAAAYAEFGKFDEAVRWQMRSLELLGPAKKTATDYQQRLKLYLERKPYRKQ
jgi:tetratricopeptide (TPR) repeat protein